MKTSHHILAPGTKLGGYVVQCHLGHGGMAEVYQVADEHSGEMHALKLLYQLGSRALFEMEYEVMVHLNHPGVVRTYRYGMYRGAPWFTMEALAGVPAHTHVKRLGKPGTKERIVETIRICALVARALQYVHSRGVVHRDLKPDNVVVLPDGRLRLVDFGIALLVGGSDPVVQAGGFVGTPGCAAPEQVTSKTVDHRADLFALGVMAFRLLNGRPPFRGTDVTDTLRKVLQEPPPSRARWAPGIPEELGKLVEQLLEKSADDRPQSAKVVASILDAISGSTQLPGTGLAVHRRQAVLRSREIAGLLRGLDESDVVFVVTEDLAHRQHTLQALVDTARKRNIVAGYAQLDSSEDWADQGVIRALVMGLAGTPMGDLAIALGEASSADDRWSRALIVAARKSKLRGYLVLACDLSVPLDANAVAQLKALSELAGPELELTLAMGAPQHWLEVGKIAHAFRGARQVRLPMLSPLQCALAVGHMLGRRAPSGDLALQIHARTLGWPTHVEAMAKELSVMQDIQAEGDRVLWGRHDLDLPVPEGLRDTLLTQIKQRNKAEQTVLQAICLTGGISLDGLVAGMSLSRPAMEVAVVDLLDDGLLIRDRSGVLTPASGLLEQVVVGRLNSALRGMLEKMLLRSPDNLPQTAFRIHALMVADRIYEAAQDALKLAAPLVREGRWQETIDILGPVVEWLDADAEFTDDVVRVHLLYAESVLAMRRSGALVGRTVSKAREHASDPLLLSHCDLVGADLQRSIGHYGNYFKLLSSAVARDDAHNDLDMDLRMSLALGRGHLWRGEARAANRLLTRVLEEDKGLGAGSGLRILVAAAEACADLADLDRAEELARTALAESRGDPVTMGEAVSVLARILTCRGAYSQALRLLAEAADKLRIMVDQRPYVTVLMQIVRCEIDLHRLGLAQDCLDEIAAVIRPGELLHIRLEASLLEGRMRVLSGEPAGADYLLQSIVSRAKTAGLLPLASEARAYMIEAQYAAGFPGEAVQPWFESRKLAFMADRNLWAFARCCWVYQRVTGTPVDPDKTFGLLVKAIDGRGLLPLEIELNLARATYYRSIGDKSEFVTAIKAAALTVATIADGLSSSEEGALRVHPWGHRVKSGIAALKARSRSTTPR